MKKLWKYIPPCYSDVQGFQAILSISDGLGIIDDPSGYKKVKPSFEVSSHKKEKGHKKDHHKKGSRKDKENENVINSKIRNDDIINGTSAKVQACVKKALSKKKPDFILLSLAPSSSMIGSDLGFEAQMIEQDYNIPSLALDIHGDKDYVYGMSQTLLAMGKLLLSKQETKENSINLIGCNPLDFSEQAYLEIKEFLSQSYSIVSVWGMKESTENLKKACQASLNVVVHSCGLRLAKYMKEEFGIPYIVCVPYGKKQCQALFEQKTIENQGTDTKKILIVAEQVLGNAIRNALSDRNCIVCSFYEMDKDLMNPGDKKLSGEDALLDLFHDDAITTIIADANQKVLCPKDKKWISLPNPALQSSANVTPYESFVNEKLDQWLGDRL